MTNNYVKNIADNIIDKSTKIEKLTKSVFPNFNIRYIDFEPISLRCKAIVAEIRNEENEKLTIFFSDFDCEYVYNEKFKYNEKKLNKLKMLFLEEMVKTFAGTNYINKLEKNYNKKIERGYKLLEKLERGYKPLQNNEEIEKNTVKKEMKQAIAEIKYLKKLAKKQTLER